MSSNGIHNNASLFLARYGPLIGGGLILAVLAVAGLSRVGCANHHTPPGYEGYIKSKPLVGAGEFIGTQRGPTSTGWVWRLEVVNIDFRPRTFSEEMKILTRDQLELEFRAHTRIQLRRDNPNRIREVVDGFGGENWYAHNVQKEFRDAVRHEVSQLEPFEVKDRMRVIGDTVLTAMKAKYADTPIEFLSVDIGDINYPEVVVGAVIHKFVTYQENERRDIELAIAQKQIEIGVAEAQGISDAQKVIRTTLDPMFLQFEALRAIEELAGQKNTTFLVMPFSKGGNAPVIMNMDAK